MPPPEAKKVLSEREIALLKKWIKQGAEWKPHWAFIKPELPELMADFERASPNDIIDRLVDQKLKVKKLQPSPLATNNALIRRVSYLLTGLPPDPEDVRAFVSNTSDHAYEKMVDKYLSSPHFGERWARHWMDLVRYGEYMGHEYDYAISGAWQYRDYLIRAFNQDVPYDLFVKEHLAGDMLDQPRYNPDQGFNESIIGTAYFFLGEGKHGPVDIKLEESDKIDNMIDVTSKTFQALTVGCARCHDHKFDPIPTTDYYAMYGMIESARIGPLPARKTLEQAAQIERLTELKGEIRSELGQELAIAAEKTSTLFVNQVRQFVQTTGEDGKDSIKYRVIGDFRKGSWEGWYSDGWAFGDAPLMGKPIFDKKSGKVNGLGSAVASSRFYSTGIMGALRSPNFIIENDSIAIRAAGINGLIRIIVDNFQVIQKPLWRGLEKLVNGGEWNTYTFDVSRLKGHKAYLQFIPGHYDNYLEGKPPQHKYRIKPDDYIEIQYAIAFDQQIPDLLATVPSEQSQFTSEGEALIKDWVKGQASPEQISALDHWLMGKEIGYSKRLSRLITSYDSIAAQLYDSTHFIGMTEGDAVFSPVFIRGSVNQLSAEKIPRRFLSAIQAGPELFPQYGSGRLAWAEAVVDPENPLTSRVIVNRLWHHLFGRGIVETVDNFGMQGKLPSHPQLLDYLALRFIEDGWSMKGMIKHILLSQSFRRSTEVLEENLAIDPNNDLLHHYPMRRLEAEAIRDGILAVSGRLDSTMYGESIPIHLTEFMGSGSGRPEMSGPLDGNGRRSIYVEVRRNFLSPLMLVFDRPIPFSTFGKRNTTNVPAQSLALVNDPFVHQQTVHWAKNVLSEEKLSVSERIRKIYFQAFSREASPEELKSAEILLDDLAKEYGLDLDEMTEDTQVWVDYCHSILNFKEFIHLM